MESWSLREKREGDAEGERDFSNWFSQFQKRCKQCDINERKYAMKRIGEAQYSFRSAFLIRRATLTFFGQY